MKKAVFIVEKTNTGYSAYAEDYNAATTGDTYKELKVNMLDALNTLLEHEGKKLATMNDITVKFDLQQFLSYYNGINISIISKKYNLNNSLISQYKSGEKFPSEEQARKVIESIKSYGQELASIDL